MSLYLQPATLAEALSLRAQHALTPLAGGTDFYPPKSGHAITTDVLDLSRIAALNTITETEDAFVIGAGVTWSQLFQAALPAHFDALKQAAREIGGAQIQNRATVVGNICNASPAADGVPALLVVNASVEWADGQASRATSLDAFILGPRQTILPSTALVTGIRVPKRPGDLRSAFAKTGARAYLLISTVMVAATIEVADGRVVSAAVAVGAASPVAKRLPALEATLQGLAVNASLGQCVTAQHMAPLTPIADVRSDSAYRIDGAVTLTRRVLNALGAQP